MHSLIAAIISVAVIAWVSIRVSNKLTSTRTNLYAEIERLQDMVIRERQALKDHIETNGGNYRDAPYMTMQELANGVEQEYKATFDHGLTDESRWLYVTAYCLAMVNADTRVYLNDNARLRAQQAKDKQASKAKAAAKGAH